MSIVNQLSEIKALVDAQAVALSINATFGLEPTETPSTPAVSIVFQNATEETANTGANLVTRQYRVRVMVERSDQVADAAQETILWTVVDGLNAVFRDKDNQYLSCNAIKLTPVSCDDGGVAQKGNMIVRYAEITVETEQLESI